MQMTYSDSLYFSDHFPYINYFQSELWFIIYDFLKFYSIFWNFWIICISKNLLNLNCYGYTVKCTQQCICMVLTESGPQLTWVNCPVSWASQQVNVRTLTGQLGPCETQRQWPRGSHWQDHVAVARRSYQPPATKSRGGALGPASWKRAQRVTDQSARWARSNAGDVSRVQLWACRQRARVDWKRAERSTMPRRLELGARTDPSVGSLCSTNVECTGVGLRGAPGTRGTAQEHA